MGTMGCIANHLKPSRAVIASVESNESSGLPSLDLAGALPPELLVHRQPTVTAKARESEVRPADGGPGNRVF